MSTDPLASRVRRLLDAGLDSVRSWACLERALRAPTTAAWLDDLGRAPLDLIAVGKAAHAMARDFLSLSAERATPSRVLVVAPRDQPLPGAVEGRRAGARSIPVETLFSEHPLPGAGGERASARVVEWVEGGAGRDLVFLLSGGASSLLPAPSRGFLLDDKVSWTDRLMRAGADIRQLNTVRVQMSRFKGGRLAARSRYRRVLVPVISDVVGNDLAFVGSGPWHPSAATGAEAASIVRSLLGGETDRLIQGFARQLEATPDPPRSGDRCFESVDHLVCGSGATALDAMLERATVESEETPRITSWGPSVIGEAREVAVRLVESVLEAQASHQPPRLGVWVGAGETTVTVHGDGLGGRNQELALAFALEWERRGCSTAAPPYAFASLGSDGRDGPTTAAGALVDERTLARIRAGGVDPAVALDRNDSHRALRSVGATVSTGPTETNVGDLLACVVATPGERR